MPDYHRGNIEWALQDIDRRLKEIEHRSLTVPDEDNRMNGKVPSRVEVKVYFDSIGRPDCTEDFYLHFEANGWHLGNGNAIGNWRARAQKWARDTPAPTVDAQGKPLPKPLTAEQKAEAERKAAEVQKHKDEQLAWIQERAKAYGKRD